MTPPDIVDSHCHLDFPDFEGALPGILEAARAWADLAADLTSRARRGKAVNLDPAALLMDTLLKIDETAGKLAP